MKYYKKFLGRRQQFLKIQMPVRYRRVDQVDSGEEESKKVQAERADRISAKIHALFWVLTSIAIIYFTDLSSLIYSDKLNR